MYSSKPNCTTLVPETLLAIPTCKGCVKIPVHEIIRIEASGNYCIVFFGEHKKLVVAKLLSWFEDKLPAQSGNEMAFLRTHRTHLVNQKYIRQQLPGKLLLFNGETVGLSKRRKKQFMQSWTNAA